MDILSTINEEDTVIINNTEYLVLKINKYRSVTYGNEFTIALTYCVYLYDEIENKKKHIFLSNKNINDYDIQLCYNNEYILK